MIVRRHVFNIFASWSVTRVVMMIAIGLCYGMMRIRLVILELVGVVLSERRVEVLLLVWPVIMLVKYHSNAESGQIVRTLCSAGAV
jgi:hypothetical protein